MRRIVLLMLPRLISQGAVQLSFLFTTRLASFLPPGRFAALSLGWTLMMLPLGILAMSTANAAFPVLAEQAATGQQTGPGGDGAAHPGQRPVPDGALGGGAAAAGPAPGADRLRAR